MGYENDVLEQEKTYTAKAVYEQIAAGTSDVQIYINMGCSSTLARKFRKWYLAGLTEQLGCVLLKDGRIIELEAWQIEQLRIGYLTSTTMARRIILDSHRPFKLQDVVVDRSEIFKALKTELCIEDFSQPPKYKRKNNGTRLD